MKEKTNQTMERAVGRRKTAAARVRITPKGTGVIVVNGKTLEAYFPLQTWQDKVRSPLALVGKAKDMDVSVKVAGGGVSAQVEAVRHGIARALLKWNEDWRTALRAVGYLTRDPRAKERKKFGLHKARRGHQWRKR